MTDRDELPPNARRWLEAARTADDPAPADRARIDAAMSNRLRALGIAAPLAPSHTPPHVDASSGSGTHASASAGSGTHAGAGTGMATHGSSATFGGLGLSGKVALALVGAGIAIAASQLAFRHAPIGSASATATTAPVVAPSAAASAPAPAMEPTQPRALESAAPTAPVSAARATHARAPIESARSRSAAPASTAALGKPATAPDERAHTADIPAQLAPDFLREEVALIESANDALRQHRYASALRLLDAHESRFAQGALGEERRGLRVLALCGLGELTVGREQRVRFLREAPHSVLARNVEAACGAEGDTTQAVEEQQP